jgi:hypothetical protein
VDGVRGTPRDGRSRNDAVEPGLREFTEFLEDKSPLIIALRRKGSSGSNETLLPE